ncbi:MAG TPA: hypothetical protein VGK10_21015 [Prolixibacteraceae bacterium]
MNQSNQLFESEPIPLRSIQQGASMASLPQEIYSQRFFPFNEHFARFARFAWSARFAFLLSYFSNKPLTLIK